IDAKSVNVSGSVDPTKPGDYEVTYSYTDAGGNQVSAKATITVVSSKASIKAKDSTLVAGPDTKWNAADNFVSATDADGNGIDAKHFTRCQTCCLGAHFQSCAFLSLLRPSIA
ncbi:bacterial Ig-like domain-containing protein, partial [Lacticaseibacillus paracasei]|uniref:bacterial Ig-like domain-containing protein n=1 Tax=Lacticaseibacillus paracasei TaxID=1597 RepID=UPI0022EC6BFD